LLQACPCSRFRQLDHGPVDIDLLKCIQTDNLRSNDVVYVLYSFKNALAEETTLVAVSQFNSLVNTGRCPGRYGCPSHGAVFQDNVHFYGGVSPGVDNLPCFNVLNNTHV